MAIDNSIGTFMLIEDDQLLGYKRSAPRVMVDMHLSNGLPDEIEVFWDGGKFIQNWIIGK